MDHPPGPEKAKSPAPDSLATEGARDLQQLSSLTERLRRYGTAKNRNHEMAGFLVLDGSKQLADRLYRCGSYLRFRYYIEHQKTRLVESHSCDVSLLCPLCAIRRGGRLLRRYIERCEHLAPEHDFHLVTLTVKNGADLAERYRHLVQSWKRITKRAAKGYGAFAQASGAFGSIEFTKSAAGWHPHMHMIWATPKGLPSIRWGKGSQLAADWQAATGDSYIVHAVRIDADGPGRASDTSAAASNPLVAALCEVLKYAVKFGDLELSDNLHAYRVLKGERLARAYGCFWGLQVPERLDDDPLDGPYLEWLFRYIGSRGYSLDGMHSSDTVTPEKAKHDGIIYQAHCGHEDPSGS